MIKHVLAFAVTVAMAVAISGVGYFGLILYAGAKGGSMGSPLNLVLVPALVAFGTALSTTIFVIPLSILASPVANRWRVMNLLSPVIVLLVGLIVFLGARPLFQRPVSAGENVLRLFAAAYLLACPSFVVYWFVLRGAGILQRRWPVSRLRSRN